MKRQKGNFQMNLKRTVKELYHLCQTRVDLEIQQTDKRSRLVQTWFMLKFHFSIFSTPKGLRFKILARITEGNSSTSHPITRLICWTLINSLKVAGRISNAQTYSPSCNRRWSELWSLFNFHPFIYLFSSSSAHPTPGSLNWCLLACHLSSILRQPFTVLNGREKKGRRKKAEEGDAQLSFKLCFGPFWFISTVGRSSSPRHPFRSGLLLLM